MIKIRLRKNLLYLLVYYIASFIKSNFIQIFINDKFRFNPMYINLFINPIENIIGGLIVFLYQRYSTRNKGKAQYFGIKLIHNKKYIARDGKFKQILLIFFAAFFNYYSYIIGSLFKDMFDLQAMEQRLSSIQIFSSTFIFIYAFRFKIKKHHKISLIIIGIFFCLLISTDMIFIKQYSYDETYLHIIGDKLVEPSEYIRTLMSRYFLVLYYYIGFSFNNCIEKYLVDTDNMNPFIILILEGVFELIMALLILIKINPFVAFAKSFRRRRKGLFLFLFILYILLQIIENIYRIYCNVIYSPMARSLIDYLLNPFVNIHDFFYNYIYLIIADIIGLVISFFGCVYNEYIILYCCGLESETQDEIAKRADSQFQTELDDIDGAFSDNENENIENDNNIKRSSTNISLDGYNIDY